VKRILLIGLVLACVAWTAPVLKRSSLAGVEQQFRSSLDKSQMEILAAPRGVYLEGYGAVFMTDINLVYTPSINPFRLTIDDQTIASIHKRKMAQVPVLRESMRQILLESGSALESVPLNEQVVLVVTFLNEQWEVTAGLPSQITMQARRSSLIEAKLGKLNAENVIRVKEL
jgi:hypothetical protein